MTPQAEAGTGQRCRCGFVLSNPMVVPHPHYSLGAWCLLLFGASTRPWKIEYRCTRCGHSFGATRDPEVLRKF